MGYQFIHIDTFGRRAKDNRDTAFIFAELRRDPAACTHVAAPRPPVVVFGRPVDEVEHDHDIRAAGAITTTVAGKARAIRQDQHTLAVVVVSHPATVQAMEADPTVAADVAAWEERSITWLRRQFGDRLASVVRHHDESHPHLHAMLLPDDSEMRAKMLHPGHGAKALTVEAALSRGLSAKEANRVGDKSYVEALRDWQDDYWQAVGLPCGLARLGPGRRRLSRGDWQREQAAMRAAKEAEQKAEEARHRMTADLADLEAGAARVRAEARTMMMAAKARLAAAEDAGRKASVMADQAARLRRQVEQRRQEIETSACRQRALGARVGLFVAGLVGLRRFLEIRHQRETTAHKARAAAERAALEAATARTIDRITQAARQAEDMAARRQREVEAAQAEVRRLRQNLGQAVAERDRARSLYGDAAARLEQSRSPGPGPHS